jgi:hypothetical protein
MGTVSRIAVAFFACVFAFASPASPCRCGSGPAFGAYAASDEVFIGRVVGKREERAPGFAFPAVRLRVRDTFKGTVTGDVDVLPDSVCPFHFEVTGDYFVYANLDPEGRLIVAQCSRTNRVEHAGADLAYARGVASGKSGAVVWGRIHLEQPVSGSRGRSQGQPIRLLLSGTAGEFETTVTDSQFELHFLPRGTYTLAAFDGVVIDVRLRRAPDRAVKHIVVGDDREASLEITVRWRQP